MSQPSTRHTDMQRFELPAPVHSSKHTWLLQALDTHAFGPFKNCLPRTYSELQLQDQTSRLSNIDWISLIVQAIQQVIQWVQWPSEFAENGFGDSRAQVSRRVWK